MKILLVNDYEGVYRAVCILARHVFGKQVEVLFARTTQEAGEMVIQHSDSLDIILVDDILGERVTYNFIDSLAKIYNGSLVAISTEYLNRRRMMELGCTENCSKFHIRNFFLNWSARNARVA